MGEKAVYRVRAVISLALSAFLAALRDLSNWISSMGVMFLTLRPAESDENNRIETSLSEDSANMNKWRLHRCGTGNHVWSRS